MNAAEAAAAVQRHNFWRQRRNLHRAKIGLPSIPLVAIDNTNRNLKIAGGAALGSALLAGAYGVKKLWDKRKQRGSGKRKRRKKRTQRGGTFTTPYCYASGRKNCMLRHIHDFVGKGIAAARDVEGEDVIDRFGQKAIRAMIRNRRKGHYI